MFVRVVDILVLRIYMYINIILIMIEKEMRAIISGIFPWYCTVLQLFTTDLSTVINLYCCTYTYYDMRKTIHIVFKIEIAFWDLCLKMFQWFHIIFIYNVFYIQKSYQIEKGSLSQPGKIFVILFRHIDIVNRGVFL